MACSILLGAAAACGRLGFDTAAERPAAVTDATGTDATVNPPAPALDGATPDALFATSACDGNPALLACYEFDNDTLDRSGRGNTGKPVGVTFEPGVSGTAARFTGASQVVITPSSDFDRVSFDIDTWLRLVALPTGTDRAFVFEHEVRFGMAIDTGGHLLCIGGQNSTVTSTTVLPLNRWTHVSCGFDGNTMTVAIDGRHNTDGTVLSSDSFAPVSIGSNVQSGEPFNGWLDRFRFWDHPLSPQELCTAAASPCLDRANERSPDGDPTGR